MMNAHIHLPSTRTRERAIATPDADVTNGAYGRAAGLDERIRAGAAGLGRPGWGGRAGAAGLGRRGWGGRAGAAGLGRPGWGGRRTRSPGDQGATRRRCRPDL